MADKQIGAVTHWYDKIGVAVVKLSGKLGKGDSIIVRKGDEEFKDTVASLQINHKDVSSAKKGDDAAIKLSQRTKEGASVFLADR
jgi:translation initiation factor IF-2